eukprot:g1947.t1
MTRASGPQAVPAASAQLIACRRARLVRVTVAVVAASITGGDSTAASRMPRWLQDALEGLAGTGGGLLGLVVVFPLERISALMQTDKDGSRRSATERLAHILRTEGWAGLYQGVESGLVAMLVTMYIFFHLHASAKRVALRALGTVQLSPLADLGAATAAGAGTAVLSNPVWLINTRLMLRSRREHEAPATAARGGSSIVQCAAEIHAEGGWPAFFQGVGPALGTVAGTGLQFMAYEQLKKVLRARARGRGAGSGAGAGGELGMTGGEVFVIGALAKMFSTIVTYPMQTVARRVQQAGGGSARRRTALECARDLVREHGALGLYAGLKPRLVQMVLQNAIKLYGFEMLLLLFHRRSAGAPAAIAAAK